MVVKYYIILFIKNKVLLFSVNMIITKIIIISGKHISFNTYLLITAADTERGLYVEILSVCHCCAHTGTRCITLISRIILLQML